MTTIRIYVEHDGPLDGRSPLHPESTSSWNAELGLIEVWSPPGASLGRLDLAPIVSGGRGSEYWVEHLTVLSASGRHSRGASIGLASPTLTDVTDEAPLPLTLVRLGASEATASGVLTEGLDVPIPIDHALVFDTRGNGKAPGPHLIQLTLGRVPRFLQAAVPSLQPNPLNKRGATSPILKALVTLGGGRTTVSTQTPSQDEGEDGTPDQNSTEPTEESP